MRALASLILLAVAALVSAWFLLGETHLQRGEGPMGAKEGEVDRWGGDLVEVAARGSKEVLGPDHVHVGEEPSSPTVLRGRGLRLEGTVFDEDGAPLAGAQIDVLASIESMVLDRSRAASAADGRYRVDLGDLEGLLDRPSEEFVGIDAFAVSAGRYSSDVFFTLDERVGDTLVWDVSLDAGRDFIRGRVIDQSGSPVEEALVEWVNGDEAHESDRFGRFDFMGLEARPGMVIGASSPGHGAAAVTLGEGQTSCHDLGDLQLVPGPGLSGHVLGPSGNGTRGLWVEAHRVGAKGDRAQRVTTAAGGAFRFANLESGASYRLLFETMSGEPAPSYRAPSQNLVLRGAAYSCMVTFVDENGAPLPPWREAARALDPRQAQPSLTSSYRGATYQLIRDESGLVRVSSYFELAQTGQWLGGAKVIDLDALPKEHTVILRGLEAAPVTFEWTGADASPIAEWTAQAVDVSTGDSVAHLGADRGPFKIPPGRYRFVVSPKPPSYLMGFSVVASVGGAGESHVQGTAFLLGGRFCLTLEGKDPGKRYPIAVYPVIGSARGTRLMGKSVELGESFESRGAIVPGEYRIVVSESRPREPDRHVAERTIRVVAGETVSVRIQVD